MRMCEVGHSGGMLWKGQRGGRDGGGGSGAGRGLLARVGDGLVGVPLQGSHVDWCVPRLQYKAAHGVAGLARAAHKRVLVGVLLRLDQNGVADCNGQRGRRTPCLLSGVTQIQSPSSSVPVSYSCSNEPRGNSLESR